MGGGCDTMRGPGDNAGVALRRGGGLGNMRMRTRGRRGRRGSQIGMRPLECNCWAQGMAVPRRLSHEKAGSRKGTRVSRSGNG